MTDTEPPFQRQYPLALRGLMRQGVGYVIVGGIQLVLDWGVFVLLSWLGMQVPMANLAGRAAGAVLGFWLNGAFTFRGADGAPAPMGWRNAVKFIIGWIVTTLLSTACVHYADQVGGLRWAWASKPVVDAALAALGFALSKYWIFR